MPTIAVAEKAGRGWFASRKSTPFRDALPYERSAAEVLKPAAESLLPQPAYEAAQSSGTRADPLRESAALTCAVQQSFNIRGAEHRLGQERFPAAEESARADRRPRAMLVFDARIVESRIHLQQLFELLRRLIMVQCGLEQFGHSQTPGNSDSNDGGEHRPRLKVAI